MMSMAVMLIGCGSDDDALVYEENKVDDVPQVDELDCGYQGNVVVCANETMTIKVNMYRMRAQYRINTEN